MDLRAVSGADGSGATLTGCDPETHTEITQAVRSPHDVRVAAGEFLERYRKAGGVLPGLELRAGVEDGASLSIAVGPSEWALVHTDEVFDQRCTQGEDTAEGSANVSWDELTLIPLKWFVPEGEAAAAVDRWLGNGTLTSLLRWGGRCRYPARAVGPPSLWRTILAWTRRPKPASTRATETASPASPTSRECGPWVDPTELKADIWESDAELDEFLADVRRSRNANLA